MAKEAFSRETNFVPFYLYGQFVLRPVMTRVYLISYSFLPKQAIFGRECAAQTDGPCCHSLISVKGFMLCIPTSSCLFQFSLTRMLLQLKAGRNLSRTQLSLQHAFPLFSSCSLSFNWAREKAFSNFSPPFPSLG